MKNEEHKNQVPVDFLDREFAEVVIQNANIRVIVTEKAVPAGLTAQAEITKQ